jgi:hypothetical protein
MKRLPLYIRMWLDFLFLRKSVFTEADMTAEELEELRAYALHGTYTHNMHFSFGSIHVVDGIVHDCYDFAPVEMNTFLDLLINVSCVYHKMGYKGYDVRIKL